jgi:DNA-binding transcriptional LysR family regulator
MAATGGDSATAGACGGGDLSADGATPSLRQISYLLAVVDDGSFTAAARRMRVAQPSLSQQIRVLERRIGTDLLRRGPRGISLTPAGQAFVGEARAALASARAAAERARGAAGLDAAAPLHVATVTSIATWLLPDAAVAWRARHGGRPLRITEFPDRGGLEAWMAAGGAELAIGPRPLAWSGPVRLLGSEPYVAMVPEREFDRLGGPAGARISVAALADADWVLYSPGHGLHEFVLGLCRRAGFIPRAAVETRQIDSATRMAAAGLGVAIVPVGCVPSELKRHRRDLLGVPSLDVVAYTRDEMSDSAADLVEAVVRTGLGPAVPDPATAHVVAAAASQRDGARRLWRSPAAVSRM